MDICYREINFFINESTLFYLLTSFTLGGIFLFLFIQSSYSFFEKRNIPRGPLPALPFGNVKDLIYKNENFNIHLWKYYNRFKRKKYYFAGLYVLLKPIVMFVDPFLIYTVLTDKQKFRDLEQATKKWDFEFFINKTVVDELFKKLHLFNDCLMNKLAKANVEVSQCLLDFYLQTTCCIVGVDDKKVQTSFLENRQNATFWFYLGLGYQKIFNIFSCRKTDEFKILVHNELDVRKKNDITKFDMLNMLPNLDNIAELEEFLCDCVQISQNLTQFCLYELCENPEIQEELIGELRRYGNENKTVNHSNIVNLNLLDAIVKETMRLYPPHATVLKRSCENWKNEKYKLNLPKDCLVTVSVYGVHHDATNFLNPEQFDPDRFCDENVKFLKDCSYLPFGVDKKGEIEMKYVTLMVKLCLNSILSKYKVSLKANTKMEFDTNKLYLAPRNQLNFKFNPL